MTNLQGITLVGDNFTENQVKIVILCSFALAISLAVWLVYAAKSIIQKSKEILPLAQ